MKQMASSNGKAMSFGKSREKLLNEKYLYKLALIIKDSIIEYLSL